MFIIKFWTNLLLHICHLLSWTPCKIWVEQIITGNQYMSREMNLFKNCFHQTQKKLPNFSCYSTEFKEFFGFKHISWAKFCGGPPKIWIFVGVLIANKHCVRGEKLQDFTSDAVFEPNFNFQETCSHIEKGSIKKTVFYGLFRDIKIYPHSFFQK